MLMGEHAVVYGYPCLVTAVDKRLFLEVEEIGEGTDKIITPQVKECRFLKEAVKLFKEKFQIKKSLKISTQGDFSHQVGLGSSSAVTVATFNALANLFQITLTKKDLFDFSYQVTLKIQKVGSGFDIAAAVYGGVLYFIGREKKIEPLNLQKLSLIIGYSGIKADTPTLIRRVAELYEKEKRLTSTILKKISLLVDQGKEQLIKKNFEKFGSLMTKNHQLLQSLGVSTPKLDRMVEAALVAGAWGAKLSGAGGGDCMISIVPSKKIENIKEAIKKNGGEIINTNVNAQGVRIE